MKTTVKKLPNCLSEITIEDTAAEYEKCRSNAIAHLAKHVQIKGFRKGAPIPEAMVIKEVGEAALADEALDGYLRKNYSKILEQTKIVPVAAGSVTKIESYDPLIIILQIETLPEVKVDEKKMEKIKLKKTEVTLDPKEVEDTLAEIEKRFTHFHDAGATSEDGFSDKDMGVQNGDRVTLDTQGFEKQGGDAIPETKVQAFPLIIGSGQFIPGFEEKLVGHKAGDVVEFEITFPKDYHSDAFKGRKVFFVTTIFRLEKPHKPEWTPEFIEQLRGVKTDFAGFKDILAKEILEEKERRAREGDEKILLDELEKISTYEIGDGLLAKEIDAVYEEQKQNLEAQKYSMKDYLSHMKTDEATYKKDVIAPEARRRIAAEIILKEIREIKKIEASDAEIQVEIEKIIAQYQNTEVVARLKQKLVPGDTYYEDIKLRLAYRKVVDQFFTTK